MKNNFDKLEKNIFLIFFSIFTTVLVSILSYFFSFAFKFLALVSNIFYKGPYNSYWHFIFFVGFFYFILYNGFTSEFEKNKKVSYREMTMNFAGRQFTFPLFMGLFILIFLGLIGIAFSQGDFKYLSK